jgi:uncharacterized zinc-type alcohol dehydrogenase-like protein
MGVKAHRSARTVLFTTSPSKTTQALADDVVISRTRRMAKHRVARPDRTRGRVPHNSPLVGLLKRDGTLLLVRRAQHPHPSPSVFQLLLAAAAGGCSSAASRKREMLDYRQRTSSRTSS